jgi:alpha-tubulin suppressor-like RCC1 family protein
VAGLADAVEVAAGDQHTCARLASGAVRCWGSNQSGQLGDGTTTDRPAPVAVQGITDAVEIAAGGHHTCARGSDRQDRCWV